MKNIKVISIVLVCVLAVAILATVLFFHFSGDSTDDIYDKLLNSNRIDYNINIMTAGGMALPDIDVYVYLDNKLEDLLDYAKTDKDGNVSFNLAEYDEYAIVFLGIPEGYDVAEYYTFEGENTDIVFTSTLVTDEDITKTKFSIGNVMYDFTVMTSDGESITLSEILKEKKMVLLNFWYNDSPWCVEQFTLFNRLYKEYKDDIEIIAFNPVDDNKVIGAYKEKYSLEFPMVACTRKFSSAFNISRTPTSIFIDKYGIVCMSQASAISTETHLRSVFDHFTAEDYEQKLYRGGIIEFTTNLLPAPTSFEVSVVDDDDNAVPGVELKVSTEASDITLTTDSDGIALFEISVMNDDILSILNCPEGYEYNGQTEIKLTEGMFVYYIELEKAE